MYISSEVIYMEFNEKIKRLREGLGLTLEQVGNAVGVGKSTVRKWETGDIANMRRDKIAKLAEALHTTPGYLMGWTESDAPQLSNILPVPSFDVTAGEYAMVRSYRKASPADKMIIDNIIARYPVEDVPAAPAVKVVPLFGTAAAAGPGEMDTGLPWEDYAVPADSGADFAVRVSGDSMEPVLHDGQIVLCSEKKPQIGDVVVVMVNGSLLVKQFITDSRNIYLRSLNRARKDADYDIWATGNDTVVCYGTVLLPRRPALVDQW